MFTIILDFHLYVYTTLGLGQGTCFRTTKINVSQSVELDTPVVFYHHSYTTIYVSLKVM